MTDELKPGDPYTIDGEVVGIVTDFPEPAQQEPSMERQRIKKLMELAKADPTPVGPRKKVIKILDDAPDALAELSKPRKRKIRKPAK